MFYRKQSLYQIKFFWCPMILVERPNNLDHFEKTQLLLIVFTASTKQCCIRNLIVLFLFLAWRFLFYLILQLIGCPLELQDNVSFRIYFKTSSVLGQCAEIYVWSSSSVLVLLFLRVFVSCLPFKDNFFFLPNYANMKAQNYG